MTSECPTSSSANLEVGSGGHGLQTGRMLERLEPIIVCERPDAVLVYGDTNSTLAGALVASKQHIPVVHVEAGLRSFNMRMPEEVDRRLTDHCSKVLCCPTATAVTNLRGEGIVDGVHLTGDVMHEALLDAARLGRDRSLLAQHHLTSARYIVATIHRAESTDSAEALRGIFQGLAKARLPVVRPAHPRLLAAIKQHAISVDSDVIRIIPPLGYIDMVTVTASARAVATDSGGLQKEAYWLGVPCLTLRTETEWVETVSLGANRLVGTGTSAIADSLAVMAERFTSPALPVPKPSERCAEIVRALCK